MKRILVFLLQVVSIHLGTSLKAQMFSALLNQSIYFRHTEEAHIDIDALCLPPVESSWHIAIDALYQPCILSTKDHAETTGVFMGNALWSDPRSRDCVPLTHETAVLLNSQLLEKADHIWYISCHHSKHEEQKDNTKNWDALFDQLLESAVGYKVFTSPNICWFPETGIDSLSSFFRAWDRLCNCKC